MRGIAGHFSDRFVRPIIGFVFDLTGAIYSVGGCRFEIPVHLTDRTIVLRFCLEATKQVNESWFGDFCELMTALLN